MKHSFSVDQLVVAKSDFDGGYIGRFVEDHPKLSDSVRIKILACIDYPLQRTIFYPGVVYERRPYEYGSVKTFDTVNVLAYDGSIPDYQKSVVVSLNAAIDSARERGDFNMVAKLRTRMAEPAMMTVV
jgi:hypothetical protein